jgi:predicted GNAT superfamily acetyltransferase
VWRLHTREIFQTYFERGYRVVDFFLSREAGRGHYLLALGDQGSASHD